jgi:hypothetical protein
MGHVDCPASQLYVNLDNHVVATIPHRKYIFSGSIVFKVSNATGIVPNITTGGPCAVPVGAVDYLGRNSTDERCPLLAIPQRGVVPCAFNIDKGVQDQILDVIRNPSGCKQITFLNGTRMCTAAVKSRHGGTALQWNLLVVFFSFAVCLLS